MKTQIWKAVYWFLRVREKSRTRAALEHTPGCVRLRFVLIPSEDGWVREVPPWSEVDRDGRPVDMRRQKGWR